MNDAQRLSHDPVMRAVVDLKDLDRMAASTSQMGRFEQERDQLDPGFDALTPVHWTDGHVSPCHGFRNNEVRLPLHALATTRATSCARWPCPTEWHTGR